jgi:pimeloyl-ACP methyl ester carboxylesterase
MDATSDTHWELQRRVKLRRGEIAYDSFGSGPPVVLVHGTPTSSFLWRKIAPALASTFEVHVFDLLGFGSSERYEEQEVSIEVHAGNLAELVAHLGLERPALAGHDIGGATVLRAHLLEGVRASKLALIDAVVLRPWITPTTRHIRKYLDAYATMPNHIWSQVTAAHLRRAVHREMSDETFVGHFGQWSGPRGQALWLRNLRQFDERHTAEFEDLLPSISIPTLILWGQEDGWLDPKISEEVQRRIPGSQRALIPEAGHFAMEDQPDEVSRLLHNFLRGD